VLAVTNYALPSLENFREPDFLELTPVRQISTKSVSAFCLKCERIIVLGSTMKILVYGAGVIGTLYGARLQQAGHHVTVLARASRRADIERHGLVLEDVVTGARSVARVSVVGQLLAEDNYDLALVTVRRDQVSGILPELALNKNTPSVLLC
jgi:Ketopantoate reductase PanE/ApbA